MKKSRVPQSLSRTKDLACETWESTNLPGLPETLRNSCGAFELYGDFATESGGNVDQRIE